MFPVWERFMLTALGTILHRGHMRIIARRRLNEFGTQFPDAKKQLDAWWAEAHHSNWKTPADIKAKYGSASFVGGNRVVFNICGNNYRLIIKFDFEAEIGFVRFIGTHAEYNNINAETV